MICQVCNCKIEPDQPTVNHHITYFPENIIIVHKGCHTKIHARRSKYTHLQPDLRQTIRFYKKRNQNFVIGTYVSKWEFGQFWDNLWFTLMTAEQRSEWLEKKKKEYWEQVSEECHQKALKFFTRV